MKGGCRRFERRYVEDDRSSEFSGKQFGRGPEPLRATKMRSSPPNTQKSRLRAQNTYLMWFGTSICEFGSCAVLQM